MKVRVTTSLFVLLVVELGDCGTYDVNEAVEQLYHHKSLASNKTLVGLDRPGRTDRRLFTTSAMRRDSLASDSGYGGGGGYGGYDCNSALGLFGLLGLLSALRNIINQLTQATTGRRKRSVEEARISLLTEMMGGLGEDVVDVMAKDLPLIIIPLVLARTKKTLSLNVSFQTITKHLQSACRSFSSGNRNDPELSLFDEAVEKEPTIYHLDVNHMLFGPSDARLPLPGNVGFSHRLRPAVEPPPVRKEKPLLDILTGDTNYDRQISILDQEKRRQEEDEEYLDELYEEELKARSAAAEMLEVKVQDCPELLKKVNFASLFPSVNVTKNPLTVLTFSQKTANDMSGWSESVEEERERLTAYFVETAKEVCKRLRAEGHWADFIDPTSGRPYLGDYTPATLFETDCRYRHFGFTIEDLGCCKVLRHHKWGTHCFVGSIFTNASSESDVISEVLDEMNLLNSENV